MLALYFVARVRAYSNQDTRSLFRGESASGQRFPVSARPSPPSSSCRFSSRSRSTSSRSCRRHPRLPHPAGRPRNAGERLPRASALLGTARSASTSLTTSCPLRASRPTLSSRLFGTVLLTKCASPRTNKYAPRCYKTSAISATKAA